MPEIFLLVCILQIRTGEREKERVITKKKTYVIEKYLWVASLSVHFIYIHIQHLHLHFHFIYIQLNKNRWNRKTSWSTFQKWCGFSSLLAPGLWEDRITILSLYGNMRVREVSYSTQWKQSVYLLQFLAGKPIWDVSYLYHKNLR